MSSKSNVHYRLDGVPRTSAKKSGAKSKTVSKSHATTVSSDDYSAVLWFFVLFIAAAIGLWFLNPDFINVDIPGSPIGREPRLSSVLLYALIFAVVVLALIWIFRSLGSNHA